MESFWLGLYNDEGIGPGKKLRNNNGTSIRRNDEISRYNFTHSSYDIRIFCVV